MLYYFKITYYKFLIYSSILYGLVASSNFKFSEFPAKNPQSLFHAAVHVNSLLTLPIQFLSSATGSPVDTNLPPAYFYYTYFGIIKIIFILIKLHPIYA